MLSRKNKDKTIKEGVVGKYVKKDTPPEIPSKLFRFAAPASIIWAPFLYFYLYFFFQLLMCGPLKRIRRKVKADGIANRFMGKRIQPLAQMRILFKRPIKSSEPMGR